MAEATAEKPKDAAADKPKTEPRKASKFNILVRTKDEPTWTLLPKQYEAVTQDDAKRDAARELAADGSDYQAVILGDGLQLVASTARGWKPIVVKVEPQPPKLTFG